MIQLTHCQAYYEMLDLMINLIKKRVRVKSEKKLMILKERSQTTMQKARKELQIYNAMIFAIQRERSSD